jgi:hypothetical protein
MIMTEGVVSQYGAQGISYMIRETDDSDSFAQKKQSEYLRKLSDRIEQERAKLNSLSLDSLSSYGTILQLDKLEKMINEYIKKKSP